ncbi:DUF2281 domain-containing protein [Dyadobacter frigoris]|uniref:DUF2281 domain-containing protein n=1 Tax=Dyadobacter frigoris TaxID=2576211 RepID=A0A4U6D8D5_9BACT|nr:DUF2281 domain-containing protein [Dyadobacter frigoris]TKT92517.1 DUF2281 domain-containing protein [Dyadobacter frigoris]GLU55311.1 hypothetical protein Dfri01_47720 [Dyadobacter frigoris]
MLTVIEGVYENGQIVLEHTPKLNTKTKVMVIFEEIIETEVAPKKRTFGISKGTIQMSPDFNDPLDDLKDYM